MKKKVLALIVCLALCLSMLPAAALGAEEPVETYTYKWSWNQDTGVHTFTRGTDFTAEDSSFMTAMVPVEEDAGTRIVCLDLQGDATIVDPPKEDGGQSTIKAFGERTMTFELNGHTLTMDNMHLGASTDADMTFQNGSILLTNPAGKNSEVIPLLSARRSGRLTLDTVEVTRTDGGVVVCTNAPEDFPKGACLTIRNSILRSTAENIGEGKGSNAMIVVADTSVVMENSTLSGAGEYPTASLTGGALTLDGGSSITATHEKATAAIVRNGDLYLNGGTLTPGTGGYAYGGRTDGTLHLSDGASASPVELRGGDQIVDNGYTGGDVVLTCTGDQQTGEILVTGCADEEAAKKFTSSAQNPVGLSYVEHDGGYTVVAAEAPVKADEYIITQDGYDRYTVTGAYKDGGAYVLIHEEMSFLTMIGALFNDVQGTGATIKLGGNLSIAGNPKTDGSYPTTGVGEGWITWDLQGHTLSLNNICMIALIDGVLTVQNGTVAYTGDEVSLDAALFAAQDNGQMILNNVTASRANGGRLLGAYSGPDADGAAVTATDCTLTTGDLSRSTPATEYGSNAILARKGSAVTLVNTTVTSGAGRPTASLVGGSLRLDGRSTVETTATDIDAALAQEGAALYLDGGSLIPATGGNAARLQSGSTLSLSGTAVAEKVQLMDDSVVVAHNGAEGADRRYYTGANVGLLYLHTEGDSMTPQLVTGCQYADTAKKFLLGTDGAPYASYRREADGSYTVIEGRSLLDLTDLSGATGTYAIHDKLDMQWLSRLAAKGTASANLHLCLTRDIDLKGGPDDPWIPIGSDSAPFRPDFHGGGHTVSGLYIDTDANDQGLFGVVDSYGSVSDLTVMGTVRGGDYVGGVAGRVKGGTITACRSGVTVSGMSYVGGVVGELSAASAVVERSCNTGTVSATGDFAGGIVGQMTPPSTLVKDCFNTGNISAQHHAGGLAGSASNGASIQNGWNTGGVSAAVYGAGGISGQLTPGGGARDCVSLGLSVSSGEYAGRVVGKAHSTVTLASNFARSDLSLTGGAMTADTAKRNGRDGESVTLTGDWQETAFAGWDFENVWNEGSGDALPTLKALGAQSLSVPRYPEPSYPSTKPKPAPEPVHTPGEFTDLEAGEWYYAPVEKVLALGLMRGTGDGKFEPLRTMARAEVWTVLARAAGESGPSGTPAPTWYTQSQQWAVEKGISDGTNPENAVTREQFVTMLWRMDGARRVKDAAPYENVSPWAIEAVAWALEQGIIEGEIAPARTITRAEAAAMLTRYLEKRAER